MLHSARVLGIAFLYLSAIGTASAQQVPERIGLLGPPEEARYAAIRSSLREGLLDQGFPTQELMILEARALRDDVEAVRVAIQEMSRQQVKLLVVIGSEPARAARAVDRELPIVYLTPGDPVEQGLAASLGRPGGETTALTLEYPELTGKRLELLRDTLPRARRIAVVFDPSDGSPRRGVEVARSSAAMLGLTVVERETRTHEDLVRALESLSNIDGLLVLPGGIPTRHYAELVAAANVRSIPTLLPVRTPSTIDALLTYGADESVIARQLARQVAKILRGARAGDLPVERPMALDLVVNLKTARQIGLTVPQSVLLRAARIIE